MLRDFVNDSCHCFPYGALETLPLSLCLFERPPPPTLLPHPPPPVLHYQSPNCPFAWAHMGLRWLQIAFNHLFEHPKRCRNNFGRNHFGPLLDPPVM